MVDPAQIPALYRTGLIEAVILLFFVVIAFGALTVLARARWLALGPTESLLARLAAAAVLSSIAVGGLSGVILNLVQQWAFSDSTLTAATARNQAVLGIGLALAVAIIAIIRLEMYHRRFVTAPVHEEEAEWKVEPPEIVGRR